MKTLFWSSLLLIACNGPGKQSVVQKAFTFEKINYSSQFGILKSEDLRQVFYIHGRDTQWGVKFQYRAEKPRIAVLSTVFAGFIELLDQQDLIVAIDKAEFYSDSVILKRVKDKRILEVGEEGQLQIERLLAQRPDYLVCSTFEFSKNTTGERLEKLGVKILYCDNFKEQHPLARAEWIKFFGIICGQYDKADSLFKVVESNYKMVSGYKNNKVSDQKAPMVMADAMFGDSWFVPGGKSFTAALIADAGGDYIFKEKQSLFTYPLSLEDVLKVGKNADIWIHTNQYYSYDALKKADQRYTFFKPFITHRIYNNNKKENQFGGNDYWERGAGRPDLILSDLHHIFYDLDISADSLHYYKMLDE